MCRNIRPLFNYDPPSTDQEIEASSLQYVRKVSGFRKPSAVNEVAFEAAVREVAAATRKLIDSLVTSAPPRDRTTEIARASERARARFGKATGG